MLELRHAAPPWRIGHGKVEIGRVKTLLSPRMASKGLKRCRDLLLPSCSFDELARERTERERGGRGRGREGEGESSSRSVQPAGFSSNRRRHDSAGPLGIDHGALPPDPTLPLPPSSLGLPREKPTATQWLLFYGEINAIARFDCEMLFIVGGEGRGVDNIGDRIFADAKGFIEK